MSYGSWGNRIPVTVIHCYIYGGLKEIVELIGVLLGVARIVNDVIITYLDLHLLQGTFSEATKADSWGYCFNNWIMHYARFMK